MIKVLKGVLYESRLKDVGLSTLEKRRLRADLLEVFKIITGMEGRKEEAFFDRTREGGTRGTNINCLRKGLQLIWENFLLEIELSTTGIAFRQM